MLMECSSKMSRQEFIQHYIEGNKSQIKTGLISDGYHTFDELYHHRMILFSIICKQNKDVAWKSWKHYDGSMFDDYFIVGITTAKGDYAYHFKAHNWDLFNVKQLDFAPEWDGHKPDDIGRLYCLVYGV